jgi:hypothetical protein
MRIDLRDSHRQPLLSVEVDVNNPPTTVRGSGSCDVPVTLDWTNAFDEAGHLRRCPACNCRELFVRKDFPQAVGFAIVVLAGIAALVLFAMNLVLWALAVLGAVVVIDGVIYLFTGRCLVCYRCRSEFRDTPIGEKHEPWDLAVGEKYRSG